MGEHVFISYAREDEPYAVRVAGNQSEAALSNVVSWWVSLPGPQRETLENLARLLNETETMLETNTAVWLKQMKAARRRLLPWTRSE